MTLRQLLNVSYVAQADSFVDEAEFDRWERELNADASGRPSSFVAPELDQFLYEAPPAA